MLQLGKNITQPSDNLQKVSCQQIFGLIKNPSDELQNKIKQLRMVLSIDPNRYRTLKTTLPYFTCGIFNPPFRKTENFGYIEHLVIDYDHIADTQVNLETLKSKLIQDQRVEMLFTSPSGNGLKVMFRLKEKIYDTQKFSMFYKIFVNTFSKEYGIDKIADSRTSDVTRACFLSCDETAYINDHPLEINIHNYIDFESAQQVFEAKQLIKTLEQQNNEADQPTETKKEIDPDILTQIKLKLNPNIRIKAEKHIVVPEELNQIIDKIKNRLNEYNIEIKRIENINYGKKIVVNLQHWWAEVNVFYGKNGFSVVKTPKRGSDAELCDITYRIICELLFNAWDEHVSI
ncbi:MAG: CRISPR-associated primase-polymerase type B [Bacteroidales bacterium]|nr:CRISPR-associated primase-polymerase type B [Bacteroidales bacterium]